MLNKKGTKPSGLVLANSETALLSCQFKISHLHNTTLTWHQVRTDFR